MQLDPEETAVVVVDMQNDFCHPDGSLYAEASEAAIDPINAVIDRARDAGASIHFTKDSHHEVHFKYNNYYDEFDRWGKHAEYDTWGYEIHDDIHFDAHDGVTEKPTYDAFERTDMDTTLHGHDDLVIVGTLANVCVMHTASSATLNDFRPIVLSDCVGYIDESHKEYALNHIDFLFGEVSDSDSIEFTASE